MTIYRRFLCFFVLLISIIGIRCKSSHNSTSQKQINEFIYVDQFKLTYFRQLLVKGFNNSNAVQEIIKFDKSGFAEPILTMDDLNLIDSLTTVDNLRMQLDSTRRVGRVAEGAEGKHPLGYILEKIESKWLDSIANKRYQASGIKGKYNE